MDQIVRWTDDFQGFKKLILIFASITVIILDVAPMIVADEFSSGLYSNLLEIIVVSINLLLLFIFRYKLIFANGIFLYFMLIVNFVATLFFTELIAYDSNFLKMTLVVMVISAMTAFLLNKYHLIAIAVLFFIYSIFAMQIMDYSLFADGVFLSSVVAFGFMAGLYILLLILERSYDKQNDLIREIEERNEELKIQTHQLSNLNKLKTRFLSIISHDVRGPLAGVIGLSEFVREDIKEKNLERADERLEVMIESLKGGNELMESLFNWVKTRDEIDLVEQKEESLYDSVIEAIAPLKVLLLSKDIDISIKIPEALSIYIDARMFNTLIRNLVSNAIKFTPAGGSITISGKKLNDSVEVVVKDTGVGIPPNVRKRMFSEERVLSTSGTDMEPGSGLGLPICKTIVDNHHGKISVESEEGKGSEFKIVVPNMD